MFVLCVLIRKVISEKLIQLFLISENLLREMRALMSLYGLLFLMPYFYDSDFFDQHGYIKRTRLRF